MGSPRSTGRHPTTSCDATEERTQPRSAAKRFPASHPPSQRAAGGRHRNMALPRARATQRLGGGRAFLRGDSRGANGAPLSLPLSLPPFHPRAAARFYPRICSLRGHSTDGCERSGVSTGHGSAETLLPPSPPPLLHIPHVRTTVPLHAQGLLGEEGRRRQACSHAVAAPSPGRKPPGGGTTSQCHQGLGGGGEPLPTPPPALHGGSKNSLVVEAAAPPLSVANNTHPSQLLPDALGRNPSHAAFPPPPVTCSQAELLPSI